jgi:hypothetical protein
MQRLRVGTAAALGAAVSTIAADVQGTLLKALCITAAALSTGIAAWIALPEDQKKRRSRINLRQLAQRHADSYLRFLWRLSRLAWVGMNFVSRTRRPARRVGADAPDDPDCRRPTRREVYWARPVPLAERAKGIEPS